MHFITHSYVHEDEILIFIRQTYRITTVIERREIVCHVGVLKQITRLERLSRMVRRMIMHACGTSFSFCGTSLTLNTDRKSLLFQKSSFSLYHLIMSYHFKLLTSFPFDIR